MTKKPDSPRKTVALVEMRLRAAREGRVDISEALLRDLLALAKAWTFTRSEADGATAFSADNQ
jgi:hypothetical protein